MTWEIHQKSLLETFEWNYFISSLILSANTKNAENTPANPPEAIDMLDVPSDFCLRILLDDSLAT